MGEEIAEVEFLLLEGRRGLKTLTVVGRSSVSAEKRRGVKFKLATHRERDRKKERETDIDDYDDY